jgi:hypothetical protein
VRRQIGHVTLALMLLAVATFLIVGACGASSRRSAIRDTFTATQAASAAFVAFDRQHQLEIVAAAKTEPEARAALDAYRVNRDRVEAVLVFAWQSIGAAATANDDPSFQKMLAAVLSLSAELKELGVKL